MHGIGTKAVHGLFFFVLFLICFVVGHWLWAFDVWATMFSVTGRTDSKH